MIPTLRALPSPGEALTWLRGFGFYRERSQLLAYLELHLPRILATLRLLPVRDDAVARPGGLLELGASPYAMSLLAMRHLGYQVTPVNFFGDYGEPTGWTDEARLVHDTTGEEHVFRYPILNVERDALPYEDGSFDVVLCCEVLEHLARDPSHMLAEIHRVLAPGGCLVLTTPNAKRLHNTWLLLRGHNVFPAYSAHGVYGRHNREYTPWDLTEILREHHFTPRVLVDDAYPHGLLYRLATALGPLRRRRDNLFAVAVAFGETVKRHPAWLYEHQESAPAARAEG